MPRGAYVPKRASVPRGAYSVPVGATGVPAAS